MSARQRFWGRPIAVLGFVLLAGGAPAAAAPQLCTSGVFNPQGIVATHLFAKIDGAWIEPSGLCVAATVAETARPDGTIGRTLNLHVFSGDGQYGGFPETGLPVGTPISLGLQLPPGMLFENVNAGWRNATIVTDGSDVVIQARTARWDYHGEAYFGSGLDCSVAPAVFPSTFGAWIGLNSLNADRTPVASDAQYAGGYYETNAVLAGFPYFLADATGVPAGVVVGVSGCGDKDPATHEGYFDGFTPVSVLQAFGIDQAFLDDPALLQFVLEVHDSATGGSVDAKFEPVHQRDIKLEPVPGVVMPPTPPGNGLIGVRMTSSFSYSHHVLVERAGPSPLQKLRTCLARGFTPVAGGGQIVCGKRLAVALVVGRVVRRSMAVLCSERCAVNLRVAAHGVRLAVGRGSTAKAGLAKVALRLTAAGHRLLASHGSVRAALRATGTGKDGAVVHLGRRVTLRP